MAGAHPRIELLGLHPSATRAEAAAVVAALERFMRDTAPPEEALESAPDRWRRAALLEAVSQDPELDVPDSWINS
jgi:hypothetical protein